MLWCAFGNEIEGTQNNEYTLHVQCSWRIARSGHIEIASGDVYYPHGDIEEDKDYDWDEIGSNRFDELAEAFNKKLDTTYRVKHIECDELKGLKIRFYNDVLLEIFPNDSMSYSEHWRFIDRVANKHLVVYGASVDYD